MSETAQENRGAGAVLKIANFRTLWLGQAISQIGDGITNLAMLIVVNQLTGSTVALAGVAIALALPPMLFGLGAGVIVDRFDRRRIMIVSDVLRGFIILGCMLVRDPSQVWLFYVLAFLQATVATFFDPAKSALIPQIVQGEDLLAANSLSQTTRVVTGIVGNALAGMLVGLAGNGLPAFALDAATFFISAIFISRIILPKQTAEMSAPHTANVWGQMTEGLKYVAHHRIVGTALLTCAVTMLGLGAVNVLFIPLLVNVLATPIAALGFLEAAQVVGMVIGSILVAGIAARFKTKQLLTGGVFLLGILIAVLGAAPDMWIVGVLCLIIGFVVTPVQAAVATIMQREVPNEMRGRVSSAVNSLITTSSVISMVFAGAFGELIGVRQVFYLAGAIVVLAAIPAIVLLRERTIPTMTPINAEG